MSFQQKKHEEAGSADSSANSAAATPESVSSIALSIWNPNDIMKGSVVEVSSSETYENGLPKPNGLFDRHMGVIDNGQTCDTCKQNNHNCTGHFGHIQLAKPVFFVHLQSMLLKVMRCVCWRCSKCLLTAEEQMTLEILKTKGKARFNAVVEICQKNSSKKGARSLFACSQCNAVQPKYLLAKDKKSGGGIANICYTKPGQTAKEQTKMSIENVLLILKRITDEDVELLGLSAKFSRPDWMICVVLPVPPPHVRPSVRQDGNQKAEDDLTHKLSDIIKTNKTLLDKMEKLATAADSDAAKKVIDECHGLLQYHVATFMDNEIVGLPAASQRGSGRPLKSLKQRLSAKEGRMRNNLMGKRCNFTARSVISPDANLALDELGVPLSIATNLTFPVIVTKLNIKELTMYVKNRDKHPGAKSVVKGSNGRRYCLAYMSKDLLQLEYGDTVHRHMIDGDVVLFNRQPSLHKMSMMGHRVRVLAVGSTFRLNLSVTTPYNADFDGDEMNAHLPQSYQTMAELKYLTLVPTQLISPQKNAPVMGIVQDALLAGNLMTKEGSIKLSKRDVCRLLMWNKDFDKFLPLPAPDAGGLWSGKQLFASILPQIINLTRKKDGKETRIRSYNQISGSGALDKSILGNAGGGLIHILFKDYSDQHSADFMYKAQQLFNNWLLINGFSVGLSDCQMPQHDNIPQQVSKIIDDTKEHVLTKLQESYDTPTLAEDLEIDIKRVLMEGRNEVSSMLIRENTRENRLLDMITAESKGSIINMVQISGCFGQSEVEGNRIPLTMDRRTLPYFAKDDDGADSRGFISQSLLQGLTPQQYYFYAMAGRIGIIDTAVKTAETGYIQRRLIKNMEDISVRPDHTVRDATGNIVNFLYGEDGFDACRLETVVVDFHIVSAKEFNNRYAHQFGEPLYWETYLASKDTLGAADVSAQAKLQEEYSFIVKLKEEFRDKITVWQDNNKVFSPIHLSRVIENVLAVKSGENRVVSFSSLSPLTTFELVVGQIDKMKRLLETSADSVVCKERAAHCLYIMEALMRTILSSKQVMVHWKLTHQGLVAVLHECYKMFLRGLVNPGEMVGIIASQSIGEPATQMCVDGAEVITVWNAKTHQCYHGPIGPWMDQLLLEKAATNVVLGERFVANNLDSEDCDEYYIHAVDMRTEKLERPFRIRQISRLPANGEMMQITTRTGRTVTATMSHAFLRRLAVGGMEKVSGHDLRVGDRIPVACHLPVFAGTAEAEAGTAEVPMPLNELFGSLVGAFLSGGGGERRLPENPGLVQWLRTETEAGKRVPQCMFAAPLPCVAALLRCYFDGVGNIAVQKHTIRCCSTSAQLLDDISLLLAYFDILPYKFTSEGGGGGGVMHHLAICTKYADAYVSRIGSNVEMKLAALREIVAYNGRSDCKSHMEFMDKIPKVGPLLAQMCKRAGMSRSCQQWATRESIGRRTLRKYIQQFEALGAPAESANVEILRQAHDSDVVWDKIVHIKVIPEDQTKLVYDLSVQDAETFLLGSGVLVHNTLNTFHFSGQGKSQTTTGVPRLKELLNISKHPKTPIMTVFLNPQFSGTKALATSVSNQIAMVMVKDILQSSFLKLYNKTTEDAAPADAMIHTLLKDVVRKNEFFIICLKFDRDLMVEKQIFMDSIKKKLEAHLVAKKEDDTTQVICSHDNIALLVYNITPDNVANIRKTYKKIGDVSVCGMANITSSYALEMVKVSSETINKSVQYVETDSGEFVKSNQEYLLQTDGSNLAAILNLPEIDAVRSVSNNVNEIYELFGIEAARQALIEEFTDTLSRTAYVNYRHVCLLGDVMTNKGILLSIDIHGVKKGDIGPLARASFEETVDQLVKSACFAEKDKMTGVSANIMLGQVPPTGTGTVQLLFDERKMEAQLSPSTGVDFEDDHQPITITPIKLCDAIDFGFHFTPMTTTSSLLHYNYLLPPAPAPMSL